MYDGARDYRHRVTCAPFSLGLTMTFLHLSIVQSLSAIVSFTEEHLHVAESAKRVKIVGNPWGNHQRHRFRDPEKVCTCSVRVLPACFPRVAVFYSSHGFLVSCTDVYARSMAHCPEVYYTRA